MEIESYPSWLLLWLRRGDEEMEFSGFATADETTTAASFTSIGDPILVSLDVALPPAVSCMYVQSPADGTSYRRHVITAHGDSVLFQITARRTWSESTVNHFVCSAGASQPPLLRLLPPCNFDVSKRKSLYTEAPRGVFLEARREPCHRETPQRTLDEDATGLLLRGKDEFVVAELLMAPSQMHNPAAELLLLRSGNKWIVKRVPISVASDKCRELSSWTTDTVVPVGDRMLCWVDLSIGIMLADVFHDKPGLRYVSLPVKRSIYCYPNASRNVCATAGCTVKLVDIIFSTSQCRCTVRTWRLGMDDIVWVMDGMINVDQLWAQDAWNGLPRVDPRYPVVSIDDSSAMCFLVCEDKAQWMAKVDMKSRTVQSVFRCPDRGRYHVCCGTCIPPMSLSYLTSCHGIKQH